MKQQWWSFLQRKVMEERSAVRCGGEQNIKIQSQQKTLETSVRRGISSERKMKKKIGCDPSSKWLAQMIISCCGNWLGDMEPAAFKPLQSPPYQPDVRVCRWDTEWHFTHWSLREVMTSGAASVASGRLLELGSSWELSDPEGFGFGLLQI